jgi:mycothiol system anti-sigma-R factor
MSCGKPHETPCSEVLARVYSYLDGELDDAAVYGKIREHLDECGPCLREYGLEEIVKRLVRKSCGHEAVPGELRAKVLTRIAVVRAELEVTDVSGITEVTEITEVTRIWGE